MRELSALAASLLLCACTTAPTVAPVGQVAPRPTAEAPGTAQQYPAWLEMKPGYAEACISGGGCVPMTQSELNQLAVSIMQRTLQTCRRGSSI